MSKNKTILFLDKDSDVTSQFDAIVEQLKVYKVDVIRPKHSIDVAKAVSISGGIPWDLVFHSNIELPSELETIAFTGVPMVNPYQPCREFMNRVGMATHIDRLSIKQPPWYYGHPADIPSEFGRQVIFKTVDDHLVQVVDPSMIYSLTKPGFYQQLLEEPDHSIMVYYLFGSVFACRRPSLTHQRGKTIPKEPLSVIPTDQEHTTRAIAESAGFNIVGVEFLGDHVIDVNPYPNPFYNSEAVDLIAQGLIKELQRAGEAEMQTTGSSSAQSQAAAS